MAISPLVLEEQKDGQISAAESLMKSVGDIGKLAVSLAGAAHATPMGTGEGAKAPTQPAPQAEPDIAGKIMTAGGLIASAADPRFNQAGQALAALGAKETERSRVGSAAQALGYQSPEALAVAKTQADIGETTAKTNLYGAEAQLAKEGKLPYYQATTAEAGATAGYKGAATEALKQETEFKKAMKPMPFTIGGQSFTVDPAHALSAFMQNQTLALHYAQLAQQKGLNEAQKNLYSEQSKVLSTRIPIPGQVDAQGNPLTLDPTHFIQLQAATNRDFATTYGRQIQLMTEVDKIVNQDVMARGDASKLPATSKAAIKTIADQFMTDPVWRFMGISLYARIGMAPPTQPTAGSLLTQPQVTKDSRGRILAPQNQTMPWVNAVPGGSK